MEKFLKYGNSNFFYQFDIFENMRDQWLNELMTHSKPSVMQKMTEVLAIHPRITLEELVNETGESGSAVRQCLSTCTLESYKPLMENTTYIYQNIIGKGKNKKYQDFLLHRTITIEDNREQSKKTYQLSLFGVVLALSLVRLNDMEKLRQGLYYRKISFIEYFDKIAFNYKDKLPLIFGKWELLKNILGIFSDYNFDILLNKETLLWNSDNVSVARGGNKELFDGIKEIVLQTRQQMGDFANSGLAVSLNPLLMRYKYEGRKNQFKDYYIKSENNAAVEIITQNTNALMKKINEIVILLNPLESAFKSVRSPLEFIRGVAHQVEELFAAEVTAFYYFNLYYDFEFRTRIHYPTKYYSSINDIQQYVPKSPRPKDCLSLIFKKDLSKPLIREWFYELVLNIVKLQKENYDMLKATM